MGKLILFCTNFLVKRAKLFTSVQQTSTAKLSAFFQRFQTKDRVLRVNKITNFYSTPSMAASETRCNVSREMYGEMFPERKNNTCKHLLTR